MHSFPFPFPSSSLLLFLLTGIKQALKCWIETVKLNNILKIFKCHRGLVNLSIVLDVQNLNSVSNPFLNVWFWFQ